MRADERHRFAQRLAEFVTPEVQWCGNDACRHRGSEHDLNNRCLVCECEGFATRSPSLDIATALRFAER